MKSLRRLPYFGFVIALLLVGGSLLVFGQGGTAKDKPKKTTPSKTNPRKKKATEPKPKTTPSTKTTGPTSTPVPLRTPTPEPSPIATPIPTPDPSPTPLPEIRIATLTPTGRQGVVRNQIGMDLIYVPPGSFMMGSNSGEADEKPVHKVTINEGFYMGQYEVTQAEWRQVMGTNPSYFQGDGLPVEQVSWDDAQSFISKLNERTEGFKYRLPTEAEWEYACRAGTTTDFAFGNGISSDQANFNGTYPYGAAAMGVYRQKTSAVGSFAPNAFGLYDMHGNVWEWCEDWHHASYAGAPNDGSAWLSGGEQQHRVLRGGSWSADGSGLRSAFRYWPSLVGRYDSFGLRVVAVVRIQ